MVLLDPVARAARVGEVVEAQTAEFVAQSYALDGAPPFGALVRASDGQRDVYGFVCQVTTGSIDAGRRVTARGVDEPDEAALYARNPELAALLRTEFRCVVVGYDDRGRIVHRLPPHPPRLHGFVHRCDGAELARFGERLDYLAALVGSTARCPVDELIGAALRHVAAERPDGRGYLVAAGKRLAMLLANDVQRLGAILRCAQP